MKYQVGSLNSWSLFSFCHRFPTHPFGWGVSFHYKEQGQLVDHLPARGTKRAPFLWDLTDPEYRVNGGLGSCRASLMRADDGVHMKEVTEGLGNPYSTHLQIHPEHLVGARAWAWCQGSSWCLPSSWC